MFNLSIFFIVRKSVLVIRKLVEKYKHNISLLKLTGWRLHKRKNLGQAADNFHLDR